MKENELINLAASLQELHEMWTPLPWQIPLGRALFYEGIKDLGAECGRSSGKTETASYCVWRYAREVPNSENYIIEPLFKQAKEILWASNRIQTFGPESWIESVNNTELRITFTNKSFIKLEGSDDTDALRGIKPRGLIVWDELKDIKKAAIEAVDPNRARYSSPALYLGTPPAFKNHFVEIMENLKKNPKAFHTKASSFDNPYNSKEWLLAKKEELIARGELETWLREYEAIFVIGGKNSVFPLANKLTPKVWQSIRPIDLNHWQAFIILDPGSSSVFAVKINLWNPYQRKVIWFKEFYFTSMAEMNTNHVWEQVHEVVKELKEMHVNYIEFHYDEAAAWFRNESAVHPIGKQYSLWPTQKESHPKDYGVSTIRMMMAEGRIEVTKDCPKTIWEFQNYVLDDKGKIPKKDDHLIDCERYFCAAVGLDLNENDMPKPPDKDLEPRAFRIEDDFKPDPFRDFDENFDSGSNDTFFEE